MLDCVMLDIGGTFVKHGAVQNGVFLPPGLFPVRENGTADEILQPILNHLKNHPARRAAISMPGPMDYATGTSHMAHKFAALNGVSLRRVLESQLPGTEICFLHDAAAFMLGEAFHGAAAGAECFAGVMLGTGLGFALFENGKVRMRSVRTPSLPLWNRPWQEGICEDYVSARGMRRRWLELSDTAMDVREIAESARTANEPACRLMSDTGRMLGEMLTRHLEGIRVEKIVLGGQIAKSFDLMRSAFESACSIPVSVAANIEDAALRGAWEYALHGEALFRLDDD